MAALNAPLAGEMSGHIFIKDNYFGFDDGLYVAVRVLSQMQQTGQSITDFMDSLPDIHASPELHIACADEKNSPQWKCWQIMPPGTLPPQMRLMILTG